MVAVERPQPKYQLGVHVRNSKGAGVFIFCREWGPDNRLLRGKGWMYHVYDSAVKSAEQRTIVSEEELAEFSAL